MLKLSRVAPHEWEFVYPQAYDDLVGEFNSGCELYEQGDLEKAERVFKGVLARMPDHLDAIHHLAMVLSEQNRLEEARDLWDQAAEKGGRTSPAMEGLISISAVLPCYHPPWENESGCLLILGEGETNLGPYGIVGNGSHGRWWGKWTLRQA